jgi:hypothetical protein
MLAPRPGPTGVIVPFAGGGWGVQRREQPVQIHVRFEVFTAVTMKNAVFWDIRTQFVLHRRHITSPLQSPAGQCYVRFEVFTAVTMKNAVFWGVTQFGSCKNRSFGGT